MVFTLWVLWVAWAVKLDQPFDPADPRRATPVRHLRVTARSGGRSWATRR